MKQSGEEASGRFEINQAIFFKKTVTFSSLPRKGRPEAEGMWSMEMAWAVLFGDGLEQLEGNGCKHTQVGGRVGPGHLGSEEH